MAAARHDHIVDRLKATGVAALADLGFPGLGDKGEDPVDGGRAGAQALPAARVRGCRPYGN
jgi:hypothetical protein